MTLLRERWEQRKPVARAAFFSASGPEEDSVYDMKVTGNGLLFYFAIDRRGVLSRVLVPTSHLLYVVDKNPRQASGAPADVRAFLAGGRAFDLIASTMQRSPHVSECWEAMVYDGGNRVRALLCHHAIQEIQPINDLLQDEVTPILIRDDFGDELWPDLGHKR